MRHSNRRRRQTETVRPAPVDRGDQLCCLEVLSFPAIAVLDEVHRIVVRDRLTGDATAGSDHHELPLQQ
jgi:hypothetical protein